MNKEQMSAAREALDNMDDYARMNAGVNAYGPRGVLERFISEVERSTADVSALTQAQHPDDMAVDRFSAAMKTKMAASRAKGRSGWDDESQCTMGALARMLMEHVAKGDPVDIANFAMMLHQREAAAMEHHPCYGGAAAKAIKVHSAAASAPIQKEPEADNTSAWTALQEILESKVTSDNPEAFKLKMIAVDAFTGRTPPTPAVSQSQAAGDEVNEREAFEAMVKERFVTTEYSLARAHPYGYYNTVSSDTFGGRRQPDYANVQMLWDVWDARATIAKKAIREQP